MLKIRVIFLLLLAALFGTGALSAEEIYKWTDDSGITHYSTKAAKGSKVAELPEITRGEVKLPSSLLQSCKSHLGIDCRAGADSDGSVICTDGFRDSAQRFNFLCKTAKLEVTEIGEVLASGSFKIFVRNSKPVAADGAKVIFKPDGETEYILSGPEKIEGFEVAEFIFLPPASISDKLKPEKENLSLACDNCPA